MSLTTQDLFFPPIFHASIWSAISSMARGFVGFPEANRSVYSWNGDFEKRVSFQNSGVKKPYVFRRQSNVACKDN